MNIKPEYCVQNQTERVVVNAVMLLSLLDTDSSSMWVFLHLEQCWQITETEVRVLTYSQILTSTCLSTSPVV